MKKKNTKQAIFNDHRTGIAMIKEDRTGLMVTDL